MRVCLIIIDGWGYSEIKEGNAVYIGNTRNIDNLQSLYPNILLHASGEWVGLPSGQAGNSEVGHLTIGAGRIVKQEIVVINESIRNGNMINHLNTINASRLHLIGLLSDGGVHSHIDILKSIIFFLKDKIENIFIHCIADGRDTAPNSFMKYYNEIKEYINNIYEHNKTTNNITSNTNKVTNKCIISSISGRYYAMDRNNNEDRINQAYKCYTQGKIGELNLDVKTDEYIEPVLLNEDGLIKEEDSILFYNFRADRMRQIVRRFEKYTTYTLTDYDPLLNVNVLFKKDCITDCLSSIVSLSGLRQLKVAESEKYAHVTYFLNGSVENHFNEEKRVVVDSPAVKSYDTVPMMSMDKVSREVVNGIKEGYPFIVANLASPDMVGHTGNLKAAINAVEYTDSIIGDIWKVANKEDVVLIITADHGNCEEMEMNGQMVTKHTANKVPFIICHDKYKGYKIDKQNASLSDVAPTILKIMEIVKPKTMTGNSLI